MFIQRDLFQYTRSQLGSAIDQVFGEVTPDSPYFQIVQKLHTSAERFAGYKSYWQTAEMRRAAGSEVRQAGINAQYNVNWMRTEHLHAVRTSRAAKNWQDITRDSDLYPYLEYMPSTAGEPRNEHKRLYGIVKHVDDPFWDTWLPPADWGCRCSVKQVRNPDPASLAKQPPDDVPLPPPVMRNNPGKDGVLFTDQHPMISKVKPEVREKVENAIRELTDVNLIIQKAYDQAADFDKKSKTIARKLKIEVTPVNLKSKARIIEKANHDYEGDVSKVNDMVRNTFVASGDKIEKTIQAISEKFEVVQIKRHNTPEGYTGVLMNVKQNGVIMECQVNTPQMLFAKDKSYKMVLDQSTIQQLETKAKQMGIEPGKGHEYYEKIRTLDDKKDRALIKTLEEESKSYYEKIRSIEINAPQL